MVKKAYLHRPTQLLCCHTDEAHKAVAQQLLPTQLRPQSRGPQICGPYSCSPHSCSPIQLLSPTQLRQLYLARPASAAAISWSATWILGDQIGRNFSPWANAYFGQFFFNCRSSLHFRLLFSTAKIVVKMLTKMYWATFWSIFLSTGISDTVPHRLLLQVGSNTTMLTT
jgi:hypothetical protein